MGVRPSVLKNKKNTTTSNVNNSAIFQHRTVPGWQMKGIAIYFSFLGSFGVKGWPPRAYYKKPTKGVLKKRKTTKIAEKQKTLKANNSAIFKFFLILFFFNMYRLLLSFLVIL